MSRNKHWKLALIATASTAVLYCVGCSDDKDQGDNYPFTGYVTGGTMPVAGGTDFIESSGIGGSGGTVFPENTAGTGVAGTGGDSGQVAGSSAPDAGQTQPDSAVATDSAIVTPMDSGAFADGSSDLEPDSSAVKDTGVVVPGEDPCGPNAQPVTGTARTTGAGTVYVTLSGTNEILRFTSTMIVPSEPQPRTGTIFLWPGLQPLSRDASGYGVLQPVLTWGPTCAPGAPNTYDRWWISGMYVGMPPGSFRMLCEGGDGMTVQVGDKLDTEFVLNGTIWTQVITNQSNNETVSFDWDLQGQKQQWAIFTIEIPPGSSVRLVDDLIFTDAVITFSESRPEDCYPSQQGADDYFSQPRVSADGKTCCISKVITRGSGVPASSPNEPLIFQQSALQHIRRDMGGGIWQ
ncbi:MAG: hypothetical protein JXA30_20140 [Deltaproteobacteria bacterium]|nr:hypothetical protein [Deltaproteobacteria bacterium]